MKISRIEGSDAVVVRPECDLRFDTAGAVSGFLAEAVAMGGRNIIVDLSRVERVDSSGIGCLVRALHTAQEEGKRFFLAGPRSQVRRVFRLSNLYKVFAVHPHIADALFALKDYEALVWSESEESRQFYEEVLRANGFVAALAGSQAEFDRSLLERRPALVILDMGEDGAEKKSYLKEFLVSDWDIPVAVVTGYPHEEEEYRDLGVDLFVLKPFRVEHLIADLREVVEAKQA